VFETKEPVDISVWNRPRLISGWLMHKNRILGKYERDEMRKMVVSMLGIVASASAQMIDNTDTRVQTTLAPGLKRIGTLRPKSIREISTSRWMLGCETLDREYADYETYKEYLPPLGIKRIRLQGGWARTEKDPGVYDFGWLDRIINDAVGRGLEVFLETSYGNPAYAGGGDRTLVGGFPVSEEALKAWDRWVEAMAVRYKGKVRDWGMWNEPDFSKSRTPDMVVALNLRTAEIIKRIIPDARIGALVLCAPRIPYIEPFMKAITEQNKQNLFQWVVYHHYGVNPDMGYEQVQEALATIRKYSPSIRLLQGESGAQ
jgi:hypothetical protein